MRLSSVSETQDVDEDMKEFDDLEDEDDFDEYGFGDMGGQPPMERKQELLRKLTDFDPYLKILVAEWLGMVWNEERGEYVKEPDVEPRMNIIGARWAINFIRTYARDNNILTRVGEDTYRNIMVDVIETVLLNVGTRAEEFGIRSDGDIISISNQLIHSTELVLTGAHGSKTYSEILMTTTNRHENVSVSDLPPQQPQTPIIKKRSMGERFRSWLR